jgi:8-oxo-dGTP diphosphatase
MEYVLVLPFSDDRTSLLLVRKEKGPAILKGLWNGVGGKIEPDEAPIHAAVREFSEETGMVIHESILRRLTTLWCDNTKIHVFYCFIPLPISSLPVANDVGEVFGLHRISSFTLGDASAKNAVPNLLWMIPLALQGSTAPDVFETSELMLKTDREPGIW